MSSSNPSPTVSPVRPVPYSAIDRFEPGFIENWMKRVEAHTRSTQFIGGPTLKNLEKRLAKEAQVKEARVCGNGTDAIQVALRAVGVKMGDVVLVPDLTFWATFEAVCNVGARPVTVDVDLSDLHPSVALVEEAMDRFKPAAVILVHLYGWVAQDTLKIRELCSSRKIPLIEDSAQAWAAEIDGKSVFADALISTTSFYPGKVLGGAGDGGAIFTNESELAEKVALLANHGRHSKYEHHWVGWNSRMDVLQAAFLDLCLDFMPGRLASRRYACEWYRKNLSGLGLEFRSPPVGVLENGYISVALTSPSLREKIMKGLDAAKVGYGVVYPGPISRQPGASEWIQGSLDRGNTSKICESVLNLPCFAGITENELQYVGEQLVRILK